MRRISPAPRKNPAAFEYVGAEVTAAAAKAPNNPRREIPEEVFFIMFVAPVPSPVFYPLCSEFFIQPPRCKQVIAHFDSLTKTCFNRIGVNEGEIGELLRKIGKVFVPIDTVWLQERNTFPLGGVITCL
jgi:hypothetical protein